MEAKLSSMDFSRFSRVQGSLKQRLLDQYDKRSHLLTEDELDAVVAAGSNIPKTPPLPQDIKRY